MPFLWIAICKYIQGVGPVYTHINIFCRGTFSAIIFTSIIPISYSSCNYNHRAGARPYKPTKNIFYHSITSNSSGAVWIHTHERQTIGPNRLLYWLIIDNDNLLSSLVVYLEWKKRNSRFPNTVCNKQTNILDFKKMI